MYCNFVSCFTGISSATRMAVISASSTDEESLSLMIISSSCEQLPQPPCPVTLTVDILRVVCLRTDVF